MGKLVRFIKDSIGNIIAGILVVGVLWAVLSMFNYDVFAVVFWAWNQFVSWVVRVAGYFVSLAPFRAIFKA